MPRLSTPLRRVRHLGLFAALAALVGTAACAVRPAPTEVDRERRGRQLFVAPGDDLQALVGELRGPATVWLAPGRHVLSPRPWADPSCGNCDEPATPVAASVGLRVAGRDIALVGASPEETVLVTNAGYGVLFDGCDGCRLERLTVTGGARDPDANATDAAVVVREGRVRIADTHLVGNVGRPATVAETVVGIAGIAGREGAELEIADNLVLGNSWDGIALYRGARATIAGNVVDGLELARGDTIGGGRGVGIGITRDAAATVTGNLVRRYWKGIGVFADARAVVRENVVEEVATWGIAVWDAGHGRPRAVVEGNVVWETGACGATLATPEADCGDRPCAFAGNLLAYTGRDARYDAPDLYCRQEALDLFGGAAPPAGFRLEGNLFWRNRTAGGGRDRRDLGSPELARRALPLLERLVRRPALGASAALAELRRTLSPTAGPPSGG